MSVSWGSMKKQKPTAFADWKWYDWAVVVILAGIGWGAVLGLAVLFT